MIQNRSFRALWLAEIVAELGGAIGALCNGLLLYELTKSQEAMGTLWLTYFLPSLLIQLWIGPVVDRVSRKSIMVTSQLSRAVLFLITTIILVSGSFPIWMLFVVQFVLGCIQPFYVPASMAILPTVVSAKELTQANAYMDGAVRLMSFLAPTLGGLLVFVFAVNWTYGVVSLLFFVSVLGITRIEEVPVVQQHKTAWVKQIMEGYAFFFQRKQILWLGIFTAIVQFGIGVTMVITVPFIVDELQGSSFMYGLFVAGFPLGYFIGSFLVAKFRREQHYRFSMLSGLALGGLSFVGLALANHYAFALACEIISGICFPFFNIYNTSLLQCSTPNEMRGSVFSVRLFLIRATMPLGILFASQLGDIIGVRGLYLIIGSFIVVPAIIGITAPYFKFLDVVENH